MRRSTIIAVVTVGLLAGAALWIRGMGTGEAPPAEAPVATAPVVEPIVSEPAAPQGPATAEIAGGAGAVLPVAAPDTRTLSAQGAAAVEAFARETGTSALLVWHAGALQLEYYGDGARPFDRLDGQGLHGLLLVLATGRAVQDGHIASLDDPVRLWLPEWGPDDRRGNVTVRQLLQGTSGLGAPTAEGPDGTAWTLSAAQEAAVGTRFAPNATELQVLGLVLERAVRQPLNVWLAETVWQPLGARTAEMMLDRAGGVPMMGCCVRASARDWLRLGLLLLDGGAVGGTSLVPTPWVDEIQRPTTWSRNDGTRLRLAWPFDPAGPLKLSEPFVEPDTVFAMGEGAQRLYVSKGAELVILRLGAPVPGWDEVELPNLVARNLAAIEPAQRARPQMQGGVELPPITKPPPIPSVETLPLAAPAAAAPENGKTGQEP